MLQLSNLFYDRKILSLQNGLQIGVAVMPLIDPNNLKIEGWFVNVRGEKEQLILLVSQVRDLVHKGLVVDDYDSLTMAEDLVRFKEIISLKFSLLNKEVVEENGSKIGRVKDFSVDEQSMYIKKLYVQPSSLLSITKNVRLIDRDQIVEITDKKIVIKSGLEKLNSTATAPASA